MFTGIANLFTGSVAEGVLQLAITVMASFITIFARARRDSSSVSLNYGIITALASTMMCDIWWAVYLFSAGESYAPSNPRHMAICAISAAAIFVLGNLAGSVIRSPKRDSARMWLVIAAGAVCSAMAVKYIMRAYKGIVMVGSGITDRRFYLACTIVVSALCAVAIMATLKDRQTSPQEQRLVAIGLVAAITMVTVFASNSVYRDDELEYTEITSPDGAYTYAVAEGMDSDNTLAEAYVRLNPVFARLVTQWRYDTDTTPVNDGSYTAHWDGGELTIEFDEGIIPGEISISAE